MTPRSAASKKYATVQGALPREGRPGGVPTPPPNPMDKAVPQNARTSPRVVKQPRMASSQHRYRLYTPNNAILYDAAYDGFFAGVYAGKDATSSDPSVYADIALEAVQFAQAVDSLIAPASFSTADADFIMGMAQSLIQNKYATGLPQSAYAGTAGAIATAFTVASAYLKPLPSSGSSFTPTYYTQDCSAAGVTAIAGGSDGMTLPQPTISVATTAGFPTSGVAIIDGDYVAYTGVAGGNTLTGCTGGTATMHTGDNVYIAIVYDGPMPVANQIQLTGSPPGFFYYLMPDVAWFANVSSNTSAVIFLGIVDNPTPTASMISGSGNASCWFMFTPGSETIQSAAYDNAGQGFQNEFIGDISGNSTSLFVSQIGGRGEISMVPIYGAILNPQVSVDYPRAPPSMGTGPLFGVDGVLVWYAPTTATASLLTGWTGEDASGTQQTLVPQTYYPNYGWDSQFQGNGLTNLGDSVTGPSAGTVLFVDLPDSVSGVVSSITVQVTGKVVYSDGTGTDSLGNAYYYLAIDTLKSISGVVSVVGVAAIGTPNADRSMADVTVVVASTGTQMSITITNGASIGATSRCAYAVSLVSEIE